jgi:hypothetical protein
MYSHRLTLTLRSGETAAAACACACVCGRGGARSASGRAHVRAAQSPPGGPGSRAAGSGQRAAARTRSPGQQSLAHRPAVARQQGPVTVRSAPSSTLHPLHPLHLQLPRPDTSIASPQAVRSSQAFFFMGGQVRRRTQAVKCTGGRRTQAVKWAAPAEAEAEAEARRREGDRGGLTLRAQRALGRPPPPPPPPSPWPPPQGPST